MRPSHVPISLMPKENRKRGRKNKKKTNEDTKIVEDRTETYTEPEAYQSGTVPSRNTPEVTNEAPFGYVDADIKAYFRTVDVQIRAWQEREGDASDGIEDINPNEGAQMSMVAHKLT